MTEPRPPKGEAESALPFEIEDVMRSGRRNLAFGGSGLAVALGIITWMHTQHQDALAMISTEIRSLNTQVIDLKLVTEKNARTTEEVHRLEKNLHAHDALDAHHRMSTTAAEFALRLEAMERRLVRLEGGG